MSVKIRLKRAGTKGRPFYRVVVIDSRMQRDGRFIEELGYYDPLEKPQVFNVDRDKTQMWLSKGAQPSETVFNLLKRPNNTVIAREQNRDFTPGAVRTRSGPPPSNIPSSSQNDRRGGRGGRGGPGGGRSGGGRGRRNDGAQSGTSEPAAS